MIYIIDLHGHLNNSVKMRSMGKIVRYVFWSCYTVSNILKLIYITESIIIMKYYTILQEYFNRIHCILRWKMVSN